MKKILAIAMLGTMLVGVTAFAADAVVGTWKLDVAKSKFSGTAPKSGTRVYTEDAGRTTLDQKLVGADGKEMSMHADLTYDGKPHALTGNPDADSGTGKAINGSDHRLCAHEGRQNGGHGASGRIGRWQDFEGPQQGDTRRRHELRRHLGLRQAISKPQSGSGRGKGRTRASLAPPQRTAR